MKIRFFPMVMALLVSLVVLAGVVSADAPSAGGTGGD